MTELDTLRARLDALAEQPVDEHADALEEVHDQLVAELDALADVVAGRGRTDGPQ